MKFTANCKWDVEYTDTFAGDANYCWVNRAVITLPEHATNRQVMIAAKRAMGITGMRGKTEWNGDTCEFHPYGRAEIMFIAFNYD